MADGHTFHIKRTKLNAISTIAYQVDSRAIFSNTPYISTTKPQVSAVPREKSHILRNFFTQNMKFLAIFIVLLCFLRIFAADLITYPWSKVPV